MFSIITRSNSRVLTLKRDFLEGNKFYIDKLKSSLKTADKYIEEKGVPICDYSKYYDPSPLKRKIQRTVRKAVILEKSM